MTDPIEDLIEDIAVKHGVAVGRDDPILILQTLHERLLRDAATAQQNLIDRFQEELEAIAHRWGEDARDKAERTLNAALTAGQEAMAKGLQEGGPRRRPRRCAARPKQPSHRSPRCFATRGGWQG